MVLTGIFLLHLAGSLSFGQSYESFRAEMRQIREETRFRIGPFYLSPKLAFNDMGYDNNVYYQREEDDPVSDFTGTFSPSVTVYLPIRSYIIFSLTENPEYVYFFDQKKERRWNNEISPSLRLLLFRRFVLSGTYVHSNRRRRGSSEFDVRATIVTDSYSAEFFYETARLTSIGFSWRMQNIEFEDTVEPGQDINFALRLNRQEKEGHLEFYYRVSSASFFFLKAGYTDYSFDNIESRWRDSYSYQAYTGLRFPIMGRVTGMISLGYKKLSPRLEDKQGFSGIVGDTEVEVQFFRFSLRLRYTRDSQFSYQPNNVFFIENRYGGGLSFYLSRSLKLDYEFTAGKNSYPESMTVLFPDQTLMDIFREDTYYTHSIGFMVRIIDRIGVGLKANFWERNSNIFLENRSRWFAGLDFTYEF